MLAVMMAVALLQLLTAPVPAQYSRDGRTYFDNRSSATVSIYKAPFSGRSRPVRQLVSGDICAIDSNRGEQFVVTSPTWYRVVASVKGGEAPRFRPLVIRNSHLNAIGTQRLSTTFANRSGIPVMVRLLVDGEELDWTSVGVGRTAPVSSFARMEWVARATPSGKFIQRGAIPPRSSTIVIDPPRFGGGGYWPDPDGPPEVELAIRNTTPHTLAIYKRTRFGGRRVETVRPGRVVRVRTEPGEVWRIEDTVTYEVLQIKHPSMQQAEGCVANSNESATKQLLCKRHPFCTTDCENQTKPKAGRRTLTIEEGTMIHNVLNVDDHLEAMRKIAYLKSMSKYAKTANHL